MASDRSDVIKSTEPFGVQFDRLAGRVDQAMAGYLEQGPAVPELLQRAMRYSLQAGGKRLRPVMVVLACGACGGEESAALPAAAAIEMVHTYSLIHDDLPAMDNDDYRRGQPTSHKVFGDGMAILAGDALLTGAFGILASQVQDDALARQLVQELAYGAGAAGMIGGQVADMDSENHGGNLETVRYIHTHKTAMMFRAAMRMGALCGGGDPERVELLGDFGLKLGLAFQIADDLLDVIGDPEEMGKHTGKDYQAGKLTYPALVGVEESRREVQKLMGEAVELLEPLGRAAEPLRELAEMLMDRKK